MNDGKPTPDSGRTPLRITQYVLSLISSSFFCIGNYMIGWGSYDGGQMIVRPFAAITAVDTLLGRYWETDIPMFIHHLFAIAACIYAMTLEPENFSEFYVKMSSYLSLSEISTIFNSIRWFYRGTWAKTHADRVFGLAFLIIRGISTYGCIHTLVTDKDHDATTKAGIGLGIVLPYTILNTYWGGLIIKKILLSSFKTKET